MVQWLMLALSKGSNTVGVSLPLHLRTEADPVSETLCYLVTLDFRTVDKVQKPISSHWNWLFTYPERRLRLNGAVPTLRLRLHGVHKDFTIDVSPVQLKKYRHWTTGWMPGVSFLIGTDIFSDLCRPQDRLWLAPNPIKWIAETVPPSSAEVKNARSIHLHYPIRWHKDNFTFKLIVNITSNAEVNVICPRLGQNCSIQQGRT